MTQLQAVDEHTELPKKQEKQRFLLPDGLQETNTLIAARSSFNLGGSVGEEGERDNDFLYCPTLRSQLTPRPSPFKEHNNYGGGFVSDQDRVALQSLIYASPNSAGARSGDKAGTAGAAVRRGTSRRCSVENNSDAYMPLPRFALRSGGRETIFFNPKDANIAIVTCGGLCPGLNDVVRSIVHKALDYGVPENQILGIRYGFRGFYSKEHRPMVLTRRAVDDIHLDGGTMLGTSRGGADVREIVKRLDLWKIDMLFVVGGNGGNAGAAAIQRECERCRVTTAVVAVPKSIDNDILLIDRCFGFDTAVEEAQKALMAAKVEASSAYRGIGIVKLMGRQSGFITVQAALASGVVDACLIPEVHFELHGERGLLAYVESILAKKGHAVVCVAEGAGQDILNGQGGPDAVDASGNPILKDVGTWLKSQFKAHFKDADIKYIDPSYLIRSIPATSSDRILCKMLAHGAVHGAFAGYTGVTVGLMNTHYCYLPINVIIQAPRKVDPDGELWNRLRASIGQPNFF